MLDEKGYILSKKSRVIDKLTAKEDRALKNVEFMTDEELKAVPSGSVFVFDIEVYLNFFYMAFECLDNGKFVAFERSPDKNFDHNQALWMMRRFCIVGFNSKNFDLPILEYACKGASNLQLYDAVQWIINRTDEGEKVTPFAFERKYGVKVGRYNHIDLIEVAPLQGSLKLYAGRLHCDRMQDLPFPPEYVLTQDDAEIVRLYCCNDLENTKLLFEELADDIKLRTEMSEEYGVDLRSKSDAQIAEAVINSELEKVLGYYPKKPKFDDSQVLTYNAPDFVFFQTEELQKTYNVIKNAKFYLDGNGSPIMPKELKNLSVSIGESVYTLGMGGLHSTESSVSHTIEDLDGDCIRDNDVASFYPRTILNQRLFPPHLGEAFLIVYDKIVTTRLEAKAKKDKKKANSLKIVINGSFGKLGNKYSTLYAPQLMLQVTITGQLVLLMLIEAVELAGIKVISGNTDGFISKYPKRDHEKLRSIIASWEAYTGYETEETCYSAVYSRDVNNYIAFEVDGGNEKARFLDERLGAKTKGTYSEKGSALNSILSKNPETLICTDAVLQFLKFGKPLRETIEECKDVKRFVSVKNVRGGGEKNGKYLGKVVRWYYAKNEGGCISYVGSGNKVAKSDGARPLMDLPDEFPNDIDYDKYVKEAEDMLFDCGRLVKTTTKKLSFF